MLESDVRLLSLTKLSALAHFYGLRQGGKKQLWTLRKSVTDPRTQKEHALQRSTKTTDLRLAVYRASVWVDEFMQKVHDSRLPTLSGAVRWASLEQVKAAYLRAGTCAPATRKKNFQRLESMVDDMYSARNESTSTELLDGRFVRQWQTQKKAEAEAAHLPKNVSLCEQAKRGANAIYRQARSVFSAAMLRAYDDAGLQLPAGLREFAHQGFLQAAAAPPAEQLPAEAEATLWKRLPELRMTNPAVWATVLLMFRGALRNSEAMKARWSWVVPGVDGHYFLQIHSQGDFRPKAKPRVVRLAGPVVDLLKAARVDGDDHLVPVQPVIPHPGASKEEIETATAKARTAACSAGVNAFLRSCGIAAVKGKISYRLRGHAITEKILSEGMDAAQELAGHTSRRTTEMYQGARVPYAPLGLPAPAPVPASGVTVG